MTDSPETDTEAPDTGISLTDGLAFGAGATFVVLATLGISHALTELFRRKGKCEELER